MSFLQTAWMLLGKPKTRTVRKHSRHYLANIWIVTRHVATICQSIK